MKRMTNARQLSDEAAADALLHISTCGRDEHAADEHHLPYEPTPYSVLERLAGRGLTSSASTLVDYGCGKGRVSFFLSAKTGCRSIGVERDADTLRQALQNLESFSESFSESLSTSFSAASADPRITLIRMPAEKYAVPEEADIFYFFNPFSEEILRAVIRRILESWYAAPRHLYLLFYYPSDEYVAYLMGVDELQFYDEIDCSDLFPGDARELIMIFEAE